MNRIWTPKLMMPFLLMVSCSCGGTVNDCNTDWGKLIQAAIDENYVGLVAISETIPESGYRKLFTELKTGHKSLESNRIVKRRRKIIVYCNEYTTERGYFVIKITEDCRIKDFFFVFTGGYPIFPDDRIF